LSPALERQLVASARSLRLALEGLNAEEAARAAGWLHVRPEAGGYACLLPLVDDSQREQARWSTASRRGQNLLPLATPPLDGPDAAPEDYPLAWAAVEEAVPPCELPPPATMAAEAAL
jgi:hypothetical protein